MHSKFTNPEHVHILYIFHISFYFYSGRTFLWPLIKAISLLAIRNRIENESKLRTTEWVEQKQKPLNIEQTTIYWNQNRLFVHWLLKNFIIIRNWIICLSCLRTALVRYRLSMLTPFFFSFCERSFKDLTRTLSHLTTNRKET